MAKVYAKRIKMGRTTIDNVPEKLAEVEKLLGVSEE